MRKLLIGLCLGLFIVLAYLIWPYIYSSAKAGYQISRNLVHLVSPGFARIDPEQERVNFLVLGAGGVDHTGADLTDTIMVISVNLTTYDTALISLPRDLWLTSLQAKLNTTYHYGELEAAGGGLKLAKLAVEEIIGRPIDYGVFIDFWAFTQMINLIDGLEIEVERAFVDERFPIPGQELADCDGDPDYGCRYQRLEFQAGQQLMTGERALQYVRSRNAEGEEGTDYARSRRQQKVLKALQQKLISPKFIFSSQPQQLMVLFQQSLKTDIPTESYLDLAKLVWLSRQQSPRSLVIQTDDSDSGIEGLVYHPNKLIQGHWVLLPKGEDWQLIQAEVNQFLIGK